MRTMEQRAGRELVTVQVRVVEVFKIVDGNVFDLVSLRICVSVVCILVIATGTSLPLCQVFSNISRVVFTVDNIRKPRPL